MLRPAPIAGLVAVVMLALAVLALAVPVAPGAALESPAADGTHDTADGTHDTSGIAMAYTVSPSAIPPGGRVTLTGTTSPARAGALLTVHERFGDAPWRVIGTVAVDVDGSFRLRLGRRRAVGSYTYSVSRVGGIAAPLRGADEATTRVTLAGAGEASAWRPNVGTKRSPARWGTCRIGYLVNERRMPARGMRDLREAMRRVKQVSGIRFRYLGPTSITPHLGYLGPGRNKIVVAWAPPRKSGGLIASEHIAGVGGASRVRNRYRSGSLLMNSHYAATAAPGFGSGHPHGLVLMHELGHVIGLDHSPDQLQVMASGAPLEAAVWGAADLRGLRKLGKHCR